MSRGLLIALTVVVLAGCDAAPQDLRRALAMLHNDQGAAAFTQLQDLAITGYAPAQFRLGMLYLQGEVTTERRALAERWLTRAAAQGDVGARYYRALLWLSRRRDADAVDAGAQALERLAADGFRPATLRLAQAYEAGDGLQPDVVQALSWYEQAAAQGERRAIERLATAYQNGELGLERDAALAQRWRRQLSREPFSLSD